MNFKLFHRISAFLVFLISTVVFLMTVAPTLSFWDCGEFITSAVTMAVPHPPGAPTFQLLGRIFSLLPLGADIGYRVNLLSAFASSLTVLFTFLTGMRLLRMWKGDPTTMAGALGMALSMATGALILSFSDTFWFNGVETEMYGIGMFFISAIVWIGLEWYSHSGVFDTERSLLLIAYLIGLSIGIHLLSVLAMFFVFVLFYLRDRDTMDINLKTIAIGIVLMICGFVVVYPGTVKWLPSLLALNVGWVIALAIILGLVWIVAKQQQHPQLRMASLATLLVVLGYSTYSLVLIRANDKPALNENDPYNFERLYKFLNRDQYGSYPLLKGPSYDAAYGGINPDKEKLFPRRWNQEHVERYAKYSSDMDFFLKFQLGFIYNRYFMWNFVGRAGDKQDAPAVFLGEAGDWSESAGYPNRYYAIPLLLGLLGLFFHFKKDWRTGVATGTLFLVLGVGLVVYFNMSEPQVRERDYFFVGSFYVFALWAGLGVYWLFDIISSKTRVAAAGIAIAAVAFAAAPVNMLITNHQTHDRSTNYVAFDYAYNLLQSCEKDAILFTGGDNDTFPVWYVQYVAGVRRDVRVVNLSLLNTDWYTKQLKDDRPYGALPVKLSLNNEEIENLEKNLYEYNRRLYNQAGATSRTQEEAAQKVEQLIGLTVKIPIEFPKLELSTLKDMPEVAAGLADAAANGRTVEVLEFQRRASRGSFLAQQDSLIIDIVKNNGSERPIYFATSTSPGDHAGLDQYLVVEGLAWRLSPFRIKLGGNRYYSSMNVKATWRHFKEVRETPDSGRTYGFMFRELANPKVNLDEASTKMIMTYRYVMMGLAQYAVQETNDRAFAKEVMERMETLLPQSIHKLDIMFKPDIAMLYALAGDKEKLAQVTTELEQFYMPKFEASPMESSGSDKPTPIQILLQAYQQTEQWEKAASLLEKYKTITRDNSVQSLIEQFRAKAGGATADSANPQAAVQK